MGHECTGVVKEVGSDVMTMRNGDHVVVPFTTSCSKCFYCRNGHSSRCEKGALFGSPALDGAQAEYVRVPLADGTVERAPRDLHAVALVLMADIFPTGYFAAFNGFESLGEDEVADATVVVLGCGPVGLCTIIAALQYKPKYLFAVDSVPSRLATAQSFGAEPLNFETDAEGLRSRVREATGGRGADVVLEVVGSSQALRLAFDLLRPCGAISSVGVHNSEIPWTGAEAYAKNLRLQMGRCPVRSVFWPASQLLRKKQHLFGFLNHAVYPLSHAVTAYELFDRREVFKIVFDAQAGDA
ncbi:MAG: hypothetical protein M1815_004189 [Lichina confinis]|nr:MAG: hypothetical protein M1815_004189 [Lichina confinis]